MVSGQYDTITASIFAFSLICACAEFICRYALIRSMSIRISQHFIQSFLFIFNKIIKILTEKQTFVRMYDSLKSRNNYRKRILHCSCFECIEIIRIWFFWCTLTWLSLTLWYKKNLLSIRRRLQILIDPYLRTVTVPTYDRNLYRIT